MRPNYPKQATICSIRWRLKSVCYPLIIMLLLLLPLNKVVVVASFSRPMIQVRMQNTIRNEMKRNETKSSAFFKAYFPAQQTPLAEAEWHHLSIALLFVSLWMANKSETYFGINQSLLQSTSSSRKSSSWSNYIIIDVCCFCLSSNLVGALLLREIEYLFHLKKPPTCLAVCLLAIWIWV